MKRAFSVFSTLLSAQKVPMAGLSESVNLITNFKEWRFKNPPNYAELPIDDNPEYNIPVAVKNAVFSKVPTEPLTGNISLVCSSKAALSDILDLDPAAAETEEFISFVAGKYLPDGGITVCHRYGGYQFGYWADQLGDGRAHVLGEYINRKGESWQPQLKGSGETPYSRFGDGRAVLRSSIREMVASEACHALGIPTTRAAALVVFRYEFCIKFAEPETETEVKKQAELLQKRKQKRSSVASLVASEACHALGIPTTRAAALVVSDTHKVHRDKMYTGHARPEPCAVVMRLAHAWYRIGSLEILVKRNEPHTLKILVDFIIQNHFPEIDCKDSDKYIKWYQDVCHRNLNMVAEWQGKGFTHGVLNTDNISLLGLTIDYGPYGFMDRYSGYYVPNTSDDMGRYSFRKQPEILVWNLQKLSEALTPLLTDEQKVNIKKITESLKKYVDDKILKTYLAKLGLSEVVEGDALMVEELLELMQDTQADFTMTWRQLGEVPITELKNKASVAEKWSLSKVATSDERWGRWVDSYLARFQKENVTDEARRERMNKVNPLYIPRNWILQEAIVEAEKNDFEKVRFLLEVLSKPYEVNKEAESRGFSAEPPNWACGLKLSCSS